MFKLNLKIALRNLWKNKGFTLINLGGLAIGMACCMILLLYVAYEYGYDRQFKNIDKTYVAYTNMEANGKIFSWAWTPGLLAPNLATNTPDVAYAARSTYPNSQLISNGDIKVKGICVFADPSFLKILDYKFIDGNQESALKNINSVILTKSLAEKLFGKKNPINQVLKLDNKEPLKVEAVIEDLPANNSLVFDYILPWKLYEKREPWTLKNGWGSNFCLTLVQLKDANLFNQTNGAIKDIYHRNESDVTNQAFLHPLAKWHLYGDFENGKSIGGRIDQLRIFFLLAFCILLIACVNFMNLSTARSEKRAREVGVRKAIGSSRNSLVYQFMVESLLMTFIAAVVAFVLVEVSLPYVNNLLNIKLIIQYENWKYWTILFSLILITGIMAGSYPAFYLSSFEPVKVLKGLRLGSGTGISFRKALVVFQFVFAACLIVYTVVIYQQINFIKNKPIGYKNDNLIQLFVEGNLRNRPKQELLKERLLKSGAATHISTMSMNIDNGGNNTSDLSWPGKNPNDNVLFNERGIGYDFVKTIGTELIEGREFQPNFNDSTSLIINEAAVKIMGLENPIGKVINWGDKRCKIIGLMKDFVVESPYEKVAPMVFYPSYFNDVNVILIKLDPKQNISASVKNIDAIVKEINPAYPVNKSFVNQSFEAKFKNEQLLGTLSNWFGSFAVFICCLGLLGLALFMAEQRKKEISIRKVLGASTGSILVLLNKNFVKLVFIANFIAFPLAYFIINKWLSAFEYRVSISFLPFALAAFISVLIAVITVSLQTFKVAKANAVDALKYE